MKDRAYEQVVAALVRLGCQVARESDWHVIVVRGAAVLQAVPKTPTVPVDVQRRIIRALAIAERDYLDELARPS